MIFSKEVDEEFNAPPQTGPLESVYQSDYDIQGFEPTAVAPTEVKLCCSLDPYTLVCSYSNYHSEEKNPNKLSTSY